MTAKGKSEPNAKPMSRVLILILKEQDQNLHHG